MKKNLLLSIAALAAISGSIECATVRIKNNSKSVIWARINDAMISRFSKSFDTRFEKTSKKIGPLVVAAAPFMAIEDAVNAPSGIVPHFKRINPGKSTFFNSDFAPIKKITFSARDSKNQKQLITVHPDIAGLTTEAQVTYTSPSNIVRQAAFLRPKKKLKAKK